mmetsp:Transcript_20836/g.58386  ORF Transcript_20836/g.58386 Transcript_20836/m.58386 type:complete len:213 (-) Transcript_20836:2128-2766(-)
MSWGELMLSRCRGYQTVLASLLLSAGASVMGEVLMPVWLPCNAQMDPYWFCHVSHPSVSPELLWHPLRFHTLPRGLYAIFASVPPLEARPRACAYHLGASCYFPRMKVGRSCSMQSSHCHLRHCLHPRLCLRFLTTMRSPWGAFLPHSSSIRSTNLLRTWPLPSPIPRTRCCSRLGASPLTTSTSPAQPWSPCCQITKHPLRNPRSFLTLHR